MHLYFFQREFCMHKYFFICFAFLCTLFTNAYADELQVAVFGLGGRAQDVLVECVKLKQETGKTIRVVAVCDDHAAPSYDFYINNRLSQELLNDYAHVFESTAMYPDSKEGINALLHNHPDVDRIFITSSNDRHAAHLQAVLDRSSCKNIYLEKPLFKTIEEFSRFNRDLGDRNIQVGLTLRSAPITELVAKQLNTHQSELGKLQKVQSWEHVNFGHGLSIIMMNWRRYISLSGGLLIEKSVHDLDLACFFMRAVGVHPDSLCISTETAHHFYMKKNKEQIIHKLLTDSSIRKNAERWDRVAWQRVIPFSYDNKSNIDWEKTMDHFFEEFPEGDDFSESDIIPDAYLVHAKIPTASGDVVDFELDVKLNNFALQTVRGCRLTFENGTAEVDMESSKMHIQMKDKAPLEFDLHSSGIRHAGGDMYIAHSILGILPQGKLTAQFSDPSVQLSSIIGLVAEYQALHHITYPVEVKFVDNKWSVERIPLTF
jgi:predicted dehydrogenase